jgi:hypothetical protein
MDHCGCGHCDHEEGEGCGHEEALKSSEEKVNALKKAIADLGFNVEDTDEGIKIAEK